MCGCNQAKPISMVGIVRSTAGIGITEGRVSCQDVVKLYQALLCAKKSGWYRQTSLTEKQMNKYLGELLSSISLQNSEGCLDMPSIPYIINITNEWKSISGFVC